MLFILNHSLIVNLNLVLFVSAIIPTLTKVIFSQASRSIFMSIKELRSLCSPTLLYSTFRCYFHDSRFFCRFNFCDVIQKKIKLQKLRQTSARNFFWKKQPIVCFFSLTTYRPTCFRRRWLLWIANRCIACCCARGNPCRPKLERNQPVCRPKTARNCRKTLTQMC